MYLSYLILYLAYFYFTKRNKHSLKKKKKNCFRFYSQQRRRGVSFVAADEEDGGKKEVVETIKFVKEEKPPCEDKGVWTDEPEYETQLALRVFRPTHLKGRLLI